MIAMRPLPGVAVADHPTVTSRTRSMLADALELGERVAWHLAANDDLARIEQMARKEKGRRR